MTQKITIERLWIDGFGHFSDLEIRPSAGLQLFLGKNEAGKSTLLGFIRSLLFGFERRDALTRYEPERGGFGGEMVIGTPEGGLHIRRSAGRKVEGELAVRTREGVRLPDSDLAEALGGVSRELFCEVFAFSLDELGSFERLAAEGSVSDALTAAGMQGARRLPQALAQLQRESDRVYSPHRGKKELNRALAELKGVQERLDRLGDRPTHYFAEFQRWVDAKARLATLGAERRALEEERSRLARHLQAARLLREGEALSRQWDVEPELAAFPIGGLERLDGIERHRERARAEAVEVQVGLQAIEVNKRARKQSVDLCSAAIAADKFAASRAQSRALATRAVALKERLRVAQAAWSELGLPGASQTWLDRAMTPATRNRIVVAGESLLDAERRLHIARETAEAARLALVTAEDELEALERVPDDSGLTLEEVTEKKSACEQMEATQEDLASASAALRELQAVRASVGESTLPPRTFGVGGLWIVGVACLAGIIAAGLFAEGRLRLGLLGLGVLGTMSIYLAMVRLRRDRDDALARSAAEARAKEAELVRLTQLETTLRQREEVARLALTTLGEQAGIVAHADAALRAERLRELEEAGQEARDRHERMQMRSAAQARVRRLGDEARTSEVLLSEKLKLRDRELSAWRDLLAREGLSTELAPSEALDVWSRLSELRQRLLDLQVEDAALRMEDDNLRTQGEDLVREALALGLSASGPDEAMISVRAAQEGEQAEREERRRQEERRALLEAQRSRWAKELSEAEGAREGLLRAGGCEDADSFRHRAAKAAEFQDAQRRIRELIAQAEVLAGMSSELLSVRVQEDGGEEGMLRSLDDVNARKVQCAADHEAAAEAVGSLKQQLKSWAADSELRSLRMQEEELKTRARELARRYAIDALAQQLLERAQEVHRQNHQPRLLQRVSEHFSSLTNERYGRVWAADEGHLCVLDATSKEWKAEALSRGTREQLYLAFRLALVEDLCDRKPALPIVLDDILVNFDRERADAAVALLARLAQRHQILAMTCHPWVRDLFLAHGGLVTEIENGAVIAKSSPIPIRAKPSVAAKRGLPATSASEEQPRKPVQQDAFL